jgi:hypothetical protein
MRCSERLRASRQTAHTTDALTYSLRTHFQAIMPCTTCDRFPIPTSRFKEVGVSRSRHGTLYRCRDCGTYIEVIAEERSPRFTLLSELRLHYAELSEPSNSGA